jgi:hypothetical protein
LLLMMLLPAACYVGPSCQEMGGSCITPPCMGTFVGGDVCNPSHNPGGFACCVPCPGSQTFFDGGCQ